ncbi:transposase [Laspinema sp. D3]|nr:transposase [Laspinema sp. D2c]
MKDILPLLQCLVPVVGATTVRQLSRIAKAILAMEGRVTMLGISRWTPVGGSYRTVQRFFYTVLPWATMLWVFFREHLFNKDDIYLVAVDEVIVTKAGKETHGLDRFFARLYGKPVPGLSFFALSLVSVQQRKSFPIHIEQTLKTPEEKAAAQKKKQAKSQEKKSAKNSKSVSPDETSLQNKGDKSLVKNKGGRPPRSKNKDKTQVTFTPELLRIKAAISRLLGCTNQLFPLTYLLLDGHFENNNALQIARQLKLHLISKLRQDSALFFPYKPSNPKEKPKAKYGPRLHIGQIPAKHLKKKTTDKNKITTEIYQAG